MRAAGVPDHSRRAVPSSWHRASSRSGSRFGANRTFAASVSAWHWVAAASRALPPSRRHSSRRGRPRILELPCCRRTPGVLGIPEPACMQGFMLYGPCSRPTIPARQLRPGQAPVRPRSCRKTAPSPSSLRKRASTRRTAPPVLRSAPLARLPGNAPAAPHSGAHARACGSTGGRMKCMPAALSTSQLAVIQRCLDDGMSYA